ncbi:dipeptide-binding ABC transporter [Klebsiella michiganensis]|nr:dipeptide-binding ABC transporter [Klebsiella michiganensis]
MLKAAGAADLKLNYVVNAGDEVDEQIAILLQQQLAKAGVTVNLQKVDPSQSWDMLVAGEYEYIGDVLDQRYSRPRSENHLRAGSRCQYELYDPLS